MEPNPAAPAAGRLAGRTTHLSGKTGARSSGRKGNALTVISMFAYGLKHTIPGCQQQPGCQQRPEHDSDPIHCSFDANQCKLFNVTLQSQRDCVLQPRVAESARLPWVNRATASQPQLRKKGARKRKMGRATHACARVGHAGEAYSAPGASSNLRGRSRCPRIVRRMTMLPPAQFVKENVLVEGRGD